jgi:hypothetical protein
VPASTAGYQRQYGRTTSGGQPDAFVGGAATIKPTTDSAARVFSGFDTAAYEPCMVEDINQAVRETHNAPVTDIDTTYSREPIDLDVPATMDRLYSTFTIAGERGWLHFVVVRMRVDRVLIRLTFRSYTEPLDVASVRQVATAMLARLG